MAYTTFARVQDEIRGDSIATPSNANQQIMGYIRSVTRRVDAWGYRFEPVYYTRKLTPAGTNVNSYECVLTLGDKLLEVVGTITVGTQTTIAYGSDVLPFPNDGQYPIQQLRIANPFSGPLQSWWPNCGGCNNYYESISITGFWGIRSDYTSLGWLDSLQTCPALTATQNSFLVSSVSQADALGRTPTFSPGNLMRIDNEMMEINRTDPASNTLYVSRGARGSVAATHNMGTAITIFEIEDDVVTEVTRQVGLLYARRGAYQQITTYPDGVSVSYPSDLLAGLRAMVQRFNYI